MYVANICAFHIILHHAYMIFTRYAEKLVKLTDHIYEIGIKACEFSEDNFNVINHGDFWVNNMLFKYDNDDKPIGHILVSTVIKNPLNTNAY